MSKVIAIQPTKDFKARSKAVLDDPNGSLAKLLIVASRQADKKTARESVQTETAQARVVGAGAGGLTSTKNISHIKNSADLYLLGEEKIRGKNRK